MKIHDHDEPGRERGWSMIEAIVLIAVLGIIATIGGPRITCHMQKVRFASALNDLATARDLVELYEMETGQWPPDLQAAFGPNRRIPTTILYCSDSDANKGHGNDCDFFDEDNPSGNNNHGGNPAMGYILYTIQDISAPCADIDWAYTSCCGMEPIEVDEDSDQNYPGKKGSG